MPLSPRDPFDHSFSLPIIGRTSEPLGHPLRILDHNRIQDPGMKIMVSNGVALTLNFWRSGLSHSMP